jgi:RNA polymerase sigma factor (sigma-70 family)
MSLSAQGDEQFAESFLDRPYIRAIIRYVTMCTGFPVLDEDLEQDAVLRVLRALRRVAHINHPKAFVEKIVGDTVKDFWRRKRRLENANLIRSEILSNQQSFEDRLDRARRYEELHRCLDRLPSKVRRALELYYLQDCPVREVATALAVSHSAVKMTLLRGRQELRRMMKEETHLI